MQAFKGLKGKAKDLNFGRKDQGQGLTSLSSVYVMTLTQTKTNRMQT